MTTLELVRAKIIEAVPEIAGACSSCGKVAPTIEDECDPPLAPHVNVRHRPIRLADVLVAIGVDRSQTAYLQFGQYLLCSPNGWNLRADNLDDQSEETIEFLAKILGV